MGEGSQWPLTTHQRRVWNYLGLVPLSAPTTLGGGTALWNSLHLSLFETLLGVVLMLSLSIVHPGSGHGEELIYINSYHRSPG